MSWSFTVKSTDHEAAFYQFKEAAVACENLVDAGPIIDAAGMLLLLAPDGEIKISTNGHIGDAGGNSASVTVYW